MLHIFIGYDHRQPISYNVCQYSIIQHASKPVTISPIKIDTLPINPNEGPWLKGLTPFTQTRWLTPWLAQECGADIAVFMDADILVRGDIHELTDGLDWEADLDSPKAKAIYVHKNKEQFEWPSRS